MPIKLTLLLLSALAALANACTPAAVGIAGGLRDTGPDEKEAALIREETAPYRQRGQSTIQGQAYVLRADGQAVPCANQEIHITPATTYANERAPRVLAANDIPEGEARGAQLWRTTRTDGNGNFAFHHLAAGEYYVLCKVPLVDGSDAEVVVTAAHALVRPAETLTVKVMREWP